MDNLNKVIESISSLPISYELIDIIDPNFKEEVIYAEGCSGDDLAHFRVNKTAEVLLEYLKTLKHCYEQSSESIHVIYPMMLKSSTERIEKWLEEAKSSLKEQIAEYEKECPNPSEEQTESINNQLAEAQLELDKAYDNIDDNNKKLKKYEKFREFSHILKDMVDFDESSNMIEEAEEIQSIIDLLFYDDEGTLHLTGTVGVLGSMTFYSRAQKSYEQELLDSMSDSLTDL